MNAVFNQYLFKHQSSSSEGFNNLCTIVHQVNREGIYNGEVFIDKQLIGAFQVECDKKVEQTQVNIDASAFDSLTERMNQKRDIILQRNFDVAPGGYIVFYSSGHHKGLRATLSLSDEKKEIEHFDTRKINKPDFIVFRPYMPGKYILKNLLGSQSLDIVIAEKKDGKYPHPSKLEPMAIVLRKEGFETKKSELSPFQAIVVNTEVECALSLEIEKPAGKKNESKKKK